MLKMPPEAEPEVRAAVLTARHGDPDAWEVLFRRYQLPLYAYAMDLVRDEQTSLDIVQETFVRASRHLPGLREDGRFGSWLFGIAHQLVVRTWRQRATEPFVEEGPEPEFQAGSDEPWAGLVLREDGVEVMAAIDQLPPVQRSAMLLHFLEEFTVAEIAGITQVPVGTVKSRLHYARLTLRQRLASRLR